MSRFTSSTFSLTGSVPGATSSIYSNASAHRGRGYQVPQNSPVQSPMNSSLLPTRAHTNSSLTSNTLVQPSSDSTLLPTRAHTTSSLISNSLVQPTPDPSPFPTRAHTKSSLASHNSIHEEYTSGSIHEDSTSGFSSSILESSHMCQPLRLLDTRGSLFSDSWPWPNDSEDTSSSSILGDSTSSSGFSSSILESSYMCQPLRLLDTRGPLYSDSWPWPSDSEDNSRSSILEPSKLQASGSSASIVSSKLGKRKASRFTPSTISGSIDWSFQNRLGADHLPNPNESVVTDEVEWLDTTCTMTLYTASTEDWTFSSEGPGSSDLFPVDSPCIRGNFLSEKKPFPHIASHLKKYVASRFVDSRPTAARFQSKSLTVPTTVIPTVISPTVIPTTVLPTTALPTTVLSTTVISTTVIPTTTPVIPVPTVKLPIVTDLPIIESSDYDDDYTSDYPSSLDSYLPEPEMIPTPRILATPEPTWYQKNKETIRTFGLVALGAALVIIPKLMWNF
jgi:hypothetical protein